MSIFFTVFFSIFFLVVQAEGRSYGRKKPVAAACYFNGIKVLSGSSVAAYLSETVSYGSSCESQQRTCSNGVLSGSYAFVSCSVLAAPPPPPPPEPVSSECASRTSGAVVQLSTSQIPYRNLSIGAGVRFDLSAVRYSGETLVPFKVDGGAGGCMASGDIIGTFPLSTSWDAMHDTYAINVKAPNFLIEGMRVHNYGDCVSVWTTASGFKIRGAYCSQIRDDMVSNDDGLSGSVEDSLFDGGYTFFSDRSWAAAPAGAVTEIRNNLVRLQAFDRTYRDDGIAGHGWFWKQDTADRAVKLRLHGNIFMAEKPSISSSVYLEPTSILSCKKADGSPDNIIVWLGAGPYPRPDELKTGCFTLTTDRAVWHNAVAAWKARHGY